MPLHDKQKIVLLVEKPEVIHPVIDALESCYTLVFVQNETELFEKAKHEQPDLIIVSSVYSETIFGVHRGRIGEHYLTKNIPLLMVTRNLSPESIRDIFDSPAVDYLIEPVVPGEWLARIYNHTELKRLQESLDAHIYTDELEGIVNRQAFLKRGQEEINRSRRSKNNLVLVRFDIDQLPQIHSDYGDEAALGVLTAVVKTIKHELRDTDHLGRLDSEKIAIMLIETSRLEAIMVSDRIRTTIESMKFTFEGNELSTTLSIGFTPLHKEDNTIGVLLDRAESALLDARSGEKQDEI